MIIKHFFQSPFSSKNKQKGKFSIFDESHRLRGLHPVFIFWAIGINITWQRRHNSFRSKSNFYPFDRHFLWKCFTLSVIFFQMTFIHSTTGWTQVDLRDFEKTWKHVNQGKTQFWALFVFSEATFKKPKFVDRFSLKISVLQLISVLKIPRFSCPLKTF